ncbi:MAG: hypothetical protein ABIM89_19015 [Mycobacteriales bacterium]
MTEPHPFAPVGTAVMAPPAYPPPAPAPAAAQPSYQSAGMALTELSFAPLPTEVAAAPVEPPPAGQSLVANVLPSGGVARSLSLGGRLPMIALVLVLLLGAAGAAYATGLFGKKKEDAAPIVKGKPSVSAPQVSAPTSAVVAPGKPAVTPAPKPLAGKALSVTKASSRTFGADYSITVPNGWISRQNAGLEDGSNSDVLISHVRTGQIFMLGTMDPAVMKGPLTPAKSAELRADFIAESPELNILPGSVKASVGGVAATGFDATGTVDERNASVRFVVFERGGVIYGSLWVADPAGFSASLTTYNQILASVKFAP